MANTTIIKVDGMSCEHCEKRVEKNVSAVAGVSSCKADAKAGTVEVTGDANSMPAVKEAIAAAGYDVTE